MRFRNPTLAEGARTYAEALLEGCARARVKDPRLALVETDAFPRLLRIPTVEFAIGWLHGCAEAHGVTVEELWDHLEPTLKPVFTARDVRALKREWGVGRKRRAA